MAPAPAPASYLPIQPRPGGLTLKDLIVVLGTSLQSRRPRFCLNPLQAGSTSEPRGKWLLTSGEIVFDSQVSLAVAQSWSSFWGSELQREFKVASVGYSGEE
jgi:hypothetical protein